MSFSKYASVRLYLPKRTKIACFLLMSFNTHVHTFIHSFVNFGPIERLLDNIFLGRQKLKDILCAGRENRTPVSSLARTHSTTKPYPHVFYFLTERRGRKAPRDSRHPTTISPRLEPKAHQPQAEIRLRRKPRPQLHDEIISHVSYFSNPSQ